MTYRLSPQQIGLFKAYAGAHYTDSAVDLSAIPNVALRALESAYQSCYSSGLHLAFISTLPATVLGAFCALFVRHVPLKERAMLAIGSTPH
ncbi:hypothetical protein M427DRAFT_131629 [Gonapodya prolifera JEL478]|uniref:Uncharacterized protein n=1 Tax=Gonapodya prolifera (strain JEL478) TaxID=1344416 RepID=A0A139AU56_GONPJ|nr:hypothetical protein M427DRAFT_131629 [Gonapodya prolifera JEL478]|eukprot:KXS20270.1 hypothetical protein M427DRAFT_131629 [Gonapodya prolifera JEL478]